MNNIPIFHWLSIYPLSILLFYCVIFSVRLFALLHEFVCFLNTFVYFCMRVNAFACVCMKFYRVYKHFHVSFSHVYFFVCLYAFSCVCVRFNVRLCMLLHVFTCVYVHFVRLYMCLCPLLHEYMWVYVSLTEVCVYFQVRITCVIYAFLCYIIQMHAVHPLSPCVARTHSISIYPLRINSYNSNI